MMIYKQVKEELSFQNHTQKWLSEQTGIPGSHISEFLSGKRSFKLEKLEKIAAALGKKWELADIDNVKGSLSDLLDNISNDNNILK